MWEARRRGYTCYLYYVCTDSPTINVERVRTRVGMGGHDVPTASITARYHRSLLLLRPAIALAYRAFLFDNSEKVTDQKSDAGRLLCLEFKEGAMLHRFRRSLPPWIDRFGGPIGGVQSDVELS
jgi:predicted ABC-type ATPase